ncbi:hypothetical protein BZL41_00725 [Pseudomonas sp. PIC25]|uniref:hypothetical protein n=1 Tax=Pseudomonas sp. PIC25 TaxID=1958773 RepID=UPI000BABFFCD|nr:hypothetical protein [Pseudomonas sp. PIC25]PAU66589.1 hypothetical protein BZL41_00725 [Pseudomonas sp. PIC25]
MLRHALPGLWALACIPLFSLSTPVHAEPDPRDAGATVPEAVYRSPLADYRRFEEPAEVADWRVTNDTVGRIGGWRSYAMEAYQEDAAEPEAGAESNGHSGHMQH